MVKDDLVSIIKGKQAQIAKLHAELEEAQVLLAAAVDQPRPIGTRGVRRHPRRRSSKLLERSPTACEAAKVIRAAGRPLHASAIAKLMKRRGHDVSLGTLVSTLSRWVQSRSVFYRARPNVFGLISMRRPVRSRRQK